MPNMEKETSPAHAPAAPYAESQYVPGYPPAVQTQYGQPVPAGYAPTAPAPYGRPVGPTGRIRSTWAVIGLSIITFGIYSLYYYFVTHEEMKQHSGEGVGGALGLVIALFTAGLVAAVLLPHQGGDPYAPQGRPRPGTSATGLWGLLGSVLLLGPPGWVVKNKRAPDAH